MIRAGHTAERAIDLIYRVYGANLSVAKKVKKLIDDKKIGGHPPLSTVAAQLLLRCNVLLEIVEKLCLSDIFLSLALLTLIGPYTMKYAKISLSDLFFITSYFAYYQDHYVS